MVDDSFYIDEILVKEYGVDNIFILWLVLSGEVDVFILRICYFFSIFIKSDKFNCSDLFVVFFLIKDLKVIFIF